MPESTTQPTDKTTTAPGATTAAKTTTAPGAATAAKTVDTDTDIDKGDADGDDTTTATPPPERSALDALFGEDRPPWLLVHMAKLEEQSGVDLGELTFEEMAELPPKIQRALARIVKSADDGKAGLAKTREQIAADKADAEKRQREALGAEAQNFALFRHELLKEFREGLVNKGNKPDPYSPEGIEWSLNERLKAKLDAFFGTFDKIDEQRAAAAAVAEAQSKYDARVAEITEFYEATPDLKDKKILALVKAEMAKYGNEEIGKAADGKPLVLYRMRVEDAYETVMNRLAMTGQDEERKAALAKARERVRPGGGHGRPTPALPKDFVSWSGDRKAEWLDQNPEARNAFLAEKRRTGKLV